MYSALFKKVAILFVCILATFFERNVVVVVVLVLSTYLFGACFFFQFSTARLEIAELQPSLPFCYASFACAAFLVFYSFRYIVLFCFIC